MSHPYTTQILETCSALRASGMDWSEIVLVLGEYSGEFDAPNNPEAWDTCFAELMAGGLPPEVVILLVSPHVHPGKGLLWPAVFRGIGLGLSQPDVVSSFVQWLLVRHKDGLWPTGFMATCFANLEHAGIHPATLLLTSYPTLTTPMVDALLQGPWNRPGLTPIGCRHNHWQAGISRWELNIGDLGSLNGLHATLPVTVFGDPGEHYWTHGGALGNRMVFEQDLRVVEVHGITSIGRDVTVRGDLHLIGMPELYCLDLGLRVDGNLFIYDCPALEDLPSDLDVSGYVHHFSGRMNGWAARYGEICRRHKPVMAGTEWQAIMVALWGTDTTNYNPTRLSNSIRNAVDEGTVEWLEGMALVAKLDEMDYATLCAVLAEAERHMANL